MRKFAALLFLLLIISSCNYIGKSIIVDESKAAKRVERKSKLKYNKYVTHKVKKGETLYRISKNFNVPIEVIANINNIDDATKIYVGQILKLPVQKSYKSNENKKIKKNINKKSNKTVKKDIHSNNIPISFLKRWPLAGVNRSNIIRKYGRIFNNDLKVFINNNGIDIKSSNDKRIYATNAGIVTYIDFIKGIGKTVAIRVNENYYVFYYPFDKIFVKKGEKVKEGQILGMLNGDTLHFEVRKKRQPLNPLLFLP